MKNKQVILGVGLALVITIGAYMYVQKKGFGNMISAGV